MESIANCASFRLSCTLSFERIVYPRCTSLAQLKSTRLTFRRSNIDNTFKRCVARRTGSNPGMSTNRVGQNPHSRLSTFINLHYLCFVFIYLCFTCFAPWSHWCPGYPPGKINQLIRFDGGLKGVDRRCSAEE